MSRRLHYLAIFCTLFLIGCDPLSPPAEKIDVLDYDLSTRVDLETLFMQNTARILVRSPRTLTSLRFELEGMEVERVLVDEIPAAFTHLDGIVDVAVDSPDTLSTVEIHYSGIPEKGLYAGEYGGERVVFTDSWPDRGRGWLPGIHHPSDPAAFRLTIDVPTGARVVATGVRTDSTTEERRSRFGYSLKQPVPTYSMAFAIGDFNEIVRDEPGLPRIRYEVLGADTAFVGNLDAAPIAIRYLSDLLGTYPFEQFSVVQIPLDYPGMEDAGTVFFQADRLPRDRVSGVISHEATHQWFGNTVVIDSWYDLWLNESIATYLTTLYQGYTRGPDRSRLLWAGMAEVGPGREPGGKPLYSADSSGLAPALTWEMYEKGGSVLHTLRLRIGDEAFFQALRQIATSYRSQPLNTEAFRSEMERSSGENLEAFFESWVYGAELPRLETTWAEETGRLAWQVVEHAEMLTGVSFSLEITTGEEAQYVEAGPGELQLEPAGTRPMVRPVGVMMYVE